MNAIKESKNVWEFELSTNCTCQICEKCGILTEDERCPECEGYTSPASFCGGGCYEYKLGWIDEMVKEYAVKNGHSHLILIGSRMTWRNLSGSCEPIEATGSELLKALTFGNDYLLRFELDENNLLTVTRWSHDEPTGARFHAAPSDGEVEA